MITLFHMDRFREMECAQGFAKAIPGRFTALDNLMDLVLLWDTFMYEMLNALRNQLAIVQEQDASCLLHGLTDRGLGLALLLGVQDLVIVEKEQGTVYKESCRGG